jgi:hypothetical protein
LRLDERAGTEAARTDSIIRFRYLRIDLGDQSVHYLRTVKRVDGRKACERRWTNLGGAWLPLLLAAGCSNEVLSLGKQSDIPFVFDPPTIVSELFLAGAKRANPTLTGDLLEIYFTSKQDAEHIWMASRSSRTEAFGTPTVVTATVSTSRETSSAISQDGLTLWFGSDRDGGLGQVDIWVTSRPDRNSAWTLPRNLAALNSTSRDIPRPPGQHGLVMPMASDRASPGDYQTMLATRATVSAEFSAPVPIPELDGNGPTVDGCLTDDGLFLFFSRSDPGDLYVAQRLSVTSPFGPAVPLSALNSTALESDPWMSPDQTELYFASEHSDGTLQIYVSAVHSRSP